MQRQKLHQNNDVFINIYKRLPKILDDVTYNILLYNLENKTKFDFF